MKQNPDIDRLSIEERLERLETRLPIGGTGIQSDLFVSPDVIDQCKVNAWTNVGSGLVLRIEYDDFASAPILQGGINYIRDFGVRWAAFFPIIRGALSLLSCSWGRIVCHRNTNPTATQGTWGNSLGITINPTIDWTAFDEVYTNVTQFVTTSTMINLNLWAGNPPSACLNTTAQGTPMALGNVSCYLVRRHPTYGSYFQFSFAVPTFGRTVFPGATFATLKRYWQQFHPYEGGGGGLFGVLEARNLYRNFSTNAVVLTPQALPTYQRQFYPPSWYS